MTATDTGDVLSTPDGYGTCASPVCRSRSMLRLSPAGPGAAVSSWSPSRGSTRASGGVVDQVRGVPPAHARM
jgi:hypothetical protein